MAGTDLQPRMSDTSLLHGLHEKNIYQDKLLVGILWPLKIDLVLFCFDLFIIPADLG